MRHHQIMRCDILSLGNSTMGRLSAIGARFTLTLAAILALACAISPQTAIHSAEVAPHEPQVESQLAPSPKLLAGLADPFIAATPFATWLGTAAKPQIPWQVKILPAELSYYQRIHFQVFFEIPGKQVLQRVPGGGLAFMIQMADSSGAVYQDHVSLEPHDLEKGVKKGNLQVTENMLVVPGIYDLAVAVYDQKTGEHSFQQQRVNIPQLDHDALPNSWPAAPRVQFFDPDDPGFKVYRSSPPVRLHLPLETRRPLRLEVILDFAVPVRAANSHSFYNEWLGAKLGQLAALSQIELKNGSLRVEIADSIHGRVLFDQQDVREFDWPRLQKAIEVIAPARVDLSALQRTVDSNVFLFRELQSRFDRAAGSAEGASKPLNVYVFVDNALISAPAPLSFPNGADCSVYYIYTRFDFSEPPAGFAPGPPRAQPPLPELLEPLHPRVLQAASPLEFRDALGALLAELSKN